MGLTISHRVLYPWSQRETNKHINKISSKQLLRSSRKRVATGFSYINRGNYSSVVAGSNRLSTTSTSYSPLNPQFITGLTYGEGSFMVQIVKNPKLKVG